MVVVLGEGVGELMGASMSSQVIAAILAAK